jgi:hypothetical protein
MRRLLATMTALATLALPFCCAVAGPLPMPGVQVQPLEDIYNAIEDFVREDYLSSWFSSPQLIRRHFADPLDYYFGKEQVPLQEVLRDKIAYVTRWPQRYYRLVDDSLTVSRTEVDPNTYSVTFKYEWETRRVGDERAGLGETDLILRVDGGDIVIRGEGGKVLERYETPATGMSATGSAGADAEASDSGALGSPAAGSGAPVPAAKAAGAN